MENEYIYERSCPFCKEKIGYRSFYCFNRANKTNSVCLSCRQYPDRVIQAKDRNNIDIPITQSILSILPEDMRELKDCLVAGTFGSGNFKGFK